MKAKSGYWVIGALTLVMAVSTARRAHADNSSQQQNTVAPDASAVAPASDEAQSKMKLDEAKQKKKNTTAGAEEVDELITNNNLRALSGSTSKWSIASIFNYNGGTINSAFSQDRPDISNSSGTTTKADLDGTINVKYNLGAKDALELGFGIRWIAPLAAGGPSNYNGTTFDAINPQFTYQHIYKLLGVQSVMQATFMQWTQADQTALGYDKNVNVDQEMAYEIPHTKLSVGASFYAQYQTFDKSGSFGSNAQGNYIADLRSVQSEYQLALMPLLEYQLTEKVNLRTLVGLWNYEHYLNQAANTYTQDTIYQSVGVGVSVTRDIFLYPNVQFLPEHIRGDLTNVGLSATVNVF